MAERDEYDDDRPARAAGPVPYPGKVTFAGAAWVAFGGLILVNLLAYLALTFGRDGGRGGAEAAGGMCGAVVMGLFGAAFIFVGVQSIKGTAPDTLGNGIGSLVFGALEVGYGALTLDAGLMISSAINFVAGGGLIAAGVLALMGRDEYRAWRQEQKDRRRAAADRRDDRPRRRRDEEFDDRPRRRRDEGSDDE